MKLKLTREQIEKAEGRELDALVAEHVMGHPGRTRWLISADKGKSLFIEFERKWEAEEYLKEYPKMVTGHGCEIVPLQEFPDYSTDHNAAFDVVQKFDNRFTISGPNASIAAEYQNGDEWSVELLPTAETHYYRPVYGNGSTAPIAICRAALLAQIGN